MKTEKLKRVVEGKVVYLSGGITGVENYAAQFALHEAAVKEAGARVVLSPARLPEGWDYGHYMAACKALVAVADVVVLLPGWADSPGAVVERRYADKHGVPVVEWEPEEVAVGWMAEEGDHAAGLASFVRGKPEEGSRGDAEARRVEGGDQTQGAEELGKFGSEVSGVDFRGWRGQWVVCSNCKAEGMVYWPVSGNVDERWWKCRHCRNIVRAAELGKGVA